MSMAKLMKSIAVFSLIITVILAVLYVKTHTWDEIAQAMCQAELVHETIVILSFLPILAGIRFGAYPVFIITSVLAAAFDMMFVIMQRYNGPRIVLPAECRRALRSTI